MGKSLPKVPGTGTNAPAVERSRKLKLSVKLVKRVQGPWLEVWVRNVFLFPFVMMVSTVYNRVCSKSTLFPLAHGVEIGPHRWGYFRRWGPFTEVFSACYCAAIFSLTGIIGTSPRGSFRQVVKGQTPMYGIR